MQKFKIEPRKVTVDKNQLLSGEKIIDAEAFHFSYLLEV